MWKEVLLFLVQFRSQIFDAFLTYFWTCVILPYLRTFHTLSSDLLLMRFFFISPQQKFSSLHTGSETVSEFKFSPNVLHFNTFWIILFAFSLHTRSSSCQLGTCTRNLLLVTSHCNEKRQCFGTPFVWDQPQYQYCFRLYDTAPRIIEGMYQSVQYCSYLPGNRLPYISISLLDVWRFDGLVVTA